MLMLHAVQMYLQCKCSHIVKTASPFLSNSHSPWTSRAIVEAASKTIVLLLLLLLLTSPPRRDSHSP
jgi:uncharacterized membrane protein YkvI